VVWAVTVVRPRCSGTATARTVPALTGRNSWLVEVIADVGEPSAQDRAEAAAIARRIGSRLTSQAS
jgi:hypothetical protein